MQEQLDLKDIQGIIIRGYSHLPAAHFLLLGITDGSAAKKWLSQLLKEITPGDQRGETSAMHIAFTFAGLKALGLGKAALDSFPMELEDGMTTPHKQQFLGDFADSAPDQWEWGGPGTEAVHVLLMLYAKDAGVLADGIAAIRGNFGASGGIREIKQLDTTVLYERKEHFGFHDGISQPTIKGLKRSDNDENCLEAGEFILGYKNEYGQYTPRPQVAAGADAGNLLPAAAQGVVDAPAAQGSFHDLGLNGSYLVFRQMKQDVSLFWDYMAKSTQGADGSLNEKEMEKLAAQMVGRWPDGTPLVLSPDKGERKLDDNNAFDYRRSDPDGQKCPFAAHIRRSNPKDSLDTEPAVSLAIVKKHRILRRGRSYGPQLAEKLTPLECVHAAAGDVERGLHFMCINADIGRQFEFVQNGWIYNQKFNGLYEERDPLIANHQNPQDASKTGTFCIQRDGLRTRHTGIPEFVKVKGGAYFFIPGIRALSFLANFKA
jgi:Dyp-type peroxidase family